MSNWHQQLYDNLSRLIANEQKSKAGSAITERVEGNKRIGYRSDGNVAWTIKDKPLVTTAQEIRSLIFG